MDKLDPAFDPDDHLRPTLRVPERPTTPTTRAMSPSPNRLSANLYFGYGSNLWQHQVAHRCPSAQYLGVGRLRHWRFQINKAGYANIVEAPPAPYSPATTRWLGPLMSGADEEGKPVREDNERVYGFVYRLGEGDEEKLDGYENVPNAYTKEWVLVEFWPRTEQLKGGKIDVKTRARKVRCMMYVDRNHTEDGKPSGSYVYKMNEGIQDALGEGIPEKYIDEIVRKYIPTANEDSYDKLVSVAIEDAMRMGIDVKKLVEAKENELLEAKPNEEGRTMIPQDQLVKYLKSLVPDAEHGNQDPELKQFTRRRAMSIAW